MPARVKICGLTRPEDVERAILAGADYLGFIVETPSKRRLGIAEAARLAGPAKGIVPRVAVTVNASDAQIAQIMTEMDPDFIQFHGDETPARLTDIAEKHRVKTIKAVPIAGPDDVRRAGTFRGACDLILYDAKPPAGAPRGGHGLAFDWMLLAYSPLPKVFALAGGLNPDNAPEAIKRTKAPILDVSSGVEHAPGLKDPAKIKAFMKAARHG